MTSAVLAPEQYVARAEEMRADALRDVASRVGQFTSRTVDWLMSQPNASSVLTVLVVLVAATSLVAFAA